MGSGKLAAVADTGPLIHLAEIQSLSLLRLFDELHVADAVWQEAKQPATIRTELTFATRHSLEPEPVARFTAEKDLQRLQAGDRESLYLATTLEIPVVLTDDLAVRRAARKIGLTPVGSLGVIAKASHSGLITVQDAEVRLGELYATSSLFVTKAILDIAIERLRGQGA